MPKKKAVMHVEEVQPPVLPEETLTVEDVIRIFGISRTQVYYLMQEGLPSYKLGRKGKGRKRCLRFVRSELAVWFQERKTSS